jgi:hypothetical protein
VFLEATMKKLIVLAGLMALCAASAFAAPAGVDLSFTACPLDAGSSQAGVIDCAGGGVLTGLMTFAPAEAVTDLVAVDTIVDFFVQAGDVNSTSNFWDFQSFNQAGIGMNHLRPGSGCSTPTAYANTWNKTGAGVSLGALVKSPQNVRVAAGSYRPDNFAAAAGQNLFGYQLMLDGSTAVEAGGTANGCSAPAIVIVQHAIPQSAVGAPTTTLSSPSNNPTPCTSINGGVPTACAAVPTQRHTWSQLKSMYR